MNPSLPTIPLATGETQAMRDVIDRAHEASKKRRGFVWPHITAEHRAIMHEMAEDLAAERNSWSCPCPDCGDMRRWLTPILWTGGR